MKTSNHLGLFDAYGIELEYMIVNKKTLDVAPLADMILFGESTNKEKANEVVFEDISWSNELALHVLELKTTKPRSSMEGLDKEFHKHILKINDFLKDSNHKLLSTSMHPWMNPDFETKLWPHGDQIIYNTYNDLFDCRGHGWSNLQSVHLNLPFSNDEEFFVLHESIRLLLPLLPALAASSPLVQGKMGNSLDMRLLFYKDNQKRIPSIIGDYIPESVWDQKEYHTHILERIEKEIRPLDPEGVLEPEWLNSRTAIARFERMAIEIRLLDIQECPFADISITTFISAILKKWCAFFQENLRSLKRSSPEWKNYLLPAPLLKEIFLKVIEKGPGAVIGPSEKAYLQFMKKLGWSGNVDQQGGVLVKDLLWFLYEDVKGGNPNYMNHIAFILEQGTLSQRIIKNLGPRFEQKEVHALYETLSECLEKNRVFP